MHGTEADVKCFPSDKNDANSRWEIDGWLACCIKSQVFIDCDLTVSDMTVKEK